MHRNTLAVGALLATSVVALTGCGSSDSDTSHFVTVDGHGRVRGASDVLSADLGIEVTAPDVSAAVEGANTKARALINAVTAAGVGKDDVRTNGFTVRPDYGRDNTVSGYHATNTVHVVVRDLTRASKVLDDAVKAGGNDARVNNVTFAVDDNSKLLNDARTRAFKDAKSRAEQYASLAGKRLGSVITISENHGTGESPHPRIMNESPDFAAPTPLEPGTQTVDFTVTTKWELK